jgi:hypothetical protein
MCQVSEVYVGWVEIPHSLMWPFVVPVIYEFSVGWVDLAFNGVAFVECLDLADCERPGHACEDVLDAVSSAELREF